MNIEVILFDLDDTLVAFDLVTESTWRQVCAEYVAENNSVSAETVYDAVTKESRWFWSDEERHRVGRNDIVSARRSVVRSAFRALSLPDNDALRVADRYSSLRLDNMYLLPGVEETLSFLTARGMPLGMVTNGDSETQRSKIERFGLGKYFSGIFIEGEVGYGKPDRRIFESAISKFRAAPGSTVMVGDNLNWDVAGPQSVGMLGVWHDVKGKGLPPDSPVKPDAVITQIKQILDYLD